MVFIPLGIFSVFMAIYEVQADAQEFVEAYKRDYPKKLEINLLTRTGYKKPTSIRTKHSKMPLTAWLGLEVYVGLVELAPLFDNMVVKNCRISGQYWVYAR